MNAQAGVWQPEKWKMKLGNCVGENTIYVIVCVCVCLSE